MDATFSIVYSAVIGHNNRAERIAALGEEVQCEVLKMVG